VCSGRQGSPPTRGWWSPWRPWPGDLPEGLTLRDAAVGITRGASPRGLAVVRQDEIVTITPLPKGGTAAAVTGLRRSCADLQRRGVRLAVGVSTEHAGLLEVPAAYAEAQIAREGLAGAPGLLALPMLTSFDYAYKYPRLVEFRDSLPMTATGKIPQAGARPPPRARRRPLAWDRGASAGIEATRGLRRPTAPRSPGPGQVRAERKRR
jgi:hypothetical protein